MLLQRKRNSGFTLIELMVVISIMLILNGIVSVGATTVLEKAKVLQAAVKVKDLTISTQIYLLDTTVFPPPCRLDCTAETDPFLTRIGGVKQWMGPYYTVWNLEHPWGGHIGFTSGSDINGDGVNETGIIFDDDRPGTDITNNEGKIPISALRMLDRVVDNGDLATGKMQGNGEGEYGTELGEAYYYIDDKVN